MKTFSCPQCGASLRADAVKSATAECPYCNSAVIVPPELRPAAPPSDQTMYTTFGVERRTRAKTYVAAVVFTIALLVAVIALYASRSKSVPLAVTEPGRILPVATTPTATAPRSTSTPDGGVLLTFGDKGTGNGLFDDAQEIAVDANGHIYVTDDTLRVQKFDAAGNFIRTWMIPSETKWYRKVRGGPQKILADRTGNVYVLINGVLLKFDNAEGALLGAVQGSDYIHDAALLADDGLLAVSSKGGDDELVRLDARGMPKGRTHRFASRVLEKPLEVRALRVAADGTGNVFSIYALGDVFGQFWYDSEDLAVLKFTPEGKYVSRFGSQGREPGQYGIPSAIAVDNQSRIYLSDSSGIHMFAPDGRYLETVKTPFWVRAMTLDRENNIYVVGSNKVAKLAARG